MAAWYALRTKPNKEDFVWKQVATKGVEVFYPRLHVRPINPRSRKVRPYFPGYMFIHVDLAETGVTAFKWLPDAVGLVSFDGKPAVVDDGLIATLREHMDAVNRGGGMLYEGLKPGDEVMIRSGPFAGYEAIFDAGIPGRDRVRVLLSMLGRHTVPIELDAARIKPRTR